MSSDARVVPARRGRRLALWGVAGAAALALAGVVAWLAYGRSDSGSGTSTLGETALVSVTRRDLASTETFSGTLGYADPHTLVAQGQGTITALASEGSTRRRGQTLYRVDDRAVVLLYGAVPAYRSLAAGVDEGPDVLQLERNLVALGYDPDGAITVDGDYTSSTSAAVERWQAALGVAETGRVALGDAVFLPGARRVGQHAASVGSIAQPGAVVMSTSATSQEVTLQLDATRQTLAAPGRRVTVGLPDGSSVPGRITAVGKVAQAEQDPSTGTSSAATIEVDIALLRAPKDALDQAPVDVELATDSRSKVLAVPVTALLALLGGGYAVEVVDGDSTRLVTVTPGLYAGGYVEITRGLRGGERVVVPQ